jgi:hypothetical protein
MPHRKYGGVRGDAIVEYQMFLGGALGFELIRETAYRWNSSSNYEVWAQS